MLKNVLSAVIVLHCSLASVAMAQSQDQNAGSWSGPYVGFAVAHTNVTKTTSDLEPSGVAGVGILGINFYESTSLVLGVEGAMALAGDVKDGEASVESAWSASGRAGFPMGSLMPYVSLGMGQSKGKYSGDDSTATFNINVFGLGLEGKINPSLTWRLEYLNTPASNSKELGGVTVKPDSSIFRVGLTHYFK
jgi:opacity protein-like surface antigen